MQVDLVPPDAATALLPSTHRSAAKPILITSFPSSVGRDGLE